MGKPYSRQHKITYRHIAQQLKLGISSHCIASRELGARANRGDWGFLVPSEQANAQSGSVRMRISVMTRYASFFGSGDCPLKAHRVRGQNDGTKRFVWLT